MSGVSSFRIVCLALLAILTAYASADPALVSTPSDRDCWSTEEDGETTYLAPLIIDCLPGDSTCGVQEGEYIISLRPSYQRSAHSFYLYSHIPSPALRNTSIKWYKYTESYIIKNLQETEREIIRQDPGVEEILQHYWFQVDTGRDLPCRKSELTEEEKKLCYGELEVEWCKRLGSSEEEIMKCLEGSCGMEGWMLTEEQRKLCKE